MILCYRYSVPSDINRVKQMGYFIEGKEIDTFTTKDVNGLEQEMVTIQTADDHVFCVLSSFIEQQAGPLLSPYANGTVVFWDDGEKQYVDNMGTPALYTDIEYVLEDRSDQIEPPITDAVTAIEIIENEGASYQRTLDAFQFIYSSNTYLALQGSYQRTIRTLLANGEIS